MNMLDGEGDISHVTRESYFYLDGSKWKVVGRMSMLMDGPHERTAIGGMLEFINRV